MRKVQSLENLIYLIIRLVAIISAIIILCLNIILLLQEYRYDKLFTKMIFGYRFLAAIMTEVFPIADGIIIEKGFKQSDGNYIIIQHDNGYKSMYAHLSRFTCEIGDQVNIKRTIGKVGATGIVTGPFLHLSIYKDDELVNPETLIDF